MTMSIFFRTTAFMALCVSAGAHTHTHAHPASGSVDDEAYPLCEDGQCQGDALSLLGMHRSNSEVRRRKNADWCLALSCPDAGRSCTQHTTCCDRALACASSPHGSNRKCDVNQICSEVDLLKAENAALKAQMSHVQEELAQKVDKPNVTNKGPTNVTVIPSSKPNVTTVGNSSTAPNSSCDVIVDFVLRKDIAHTSQYVAGQSITADGVQNEMIKELQQAVDDVGIPGKHITQMIFTGTQFELQTEFHFPDEMTATIVGSKLMAKLHEHRMNGFQTGKYHTADIIRTTAMPPLAGCSNKCFGRKHYLDVTWNKGYNTSDIHIPLFQVMTLEPILGTATREGGRIYFDDLGLLYSYINNWNGNAWDAGYRNLSLAGGPELDNPNCTGSGAR